MRENIESPDVFEMVVDFLPGLCSTLPTRKNNRVMLLLKTFNMRNIQAWFMLPRGDAGWLLRCCVRLPNILTPQ